MKHILLILTVLISSASIAQNSKWLKGWTPEEISKANTAKNTTYLTQAEKDVFLFANLARINPDKFSRTILARYVIAKKVKKNKYLNTLKSTLKRSKAMPVLKPREDLYKNAKRHALDMGRTGKIGHRSSKGKSFKKRLEPLSKTYVGVGENCQYGWDQGIDIVIDLLIDQDVPNYGHRKNLLEKAYIYMGASIEKHKKYQWNCVQNFGAQLR